MGSIVWAGDWRPLPLGTLRAQADVVVVGTCEMEEDRGVVRVARWLKGTGEDTLVVESSDAGSSANLTPLSGVGVFFLNQRPSGRFVMFHPDCIQTMDAERALREVEMMERDLTPWLAVRPADPEVIGIIMRAFSSLRIECDASPALASWLQRRPRFLEAVTPWSARRASSLTFVRVRPHDYQCLEALNLGPIEGQIRDAVSGYTRSYGHTLADRFTISIDFVTVERAAEIEREEAIDYLRQCVARGDSECLELALEAASIVGDREFADWLEEVDSRRAAGAEDHRFWIERFRFWTERESP